MVTLRLDGCSFSWGPSNKHRHTVEIPKRLTVNMSFSMFFNVVTFKALDVCSTYWAGICCHQCARSGGPPPFEEVDCFRVDGKMGHGRKHVGGNGNVNSWFSTAAFWSSLWLFADCADLPDRISWFCIRTTCKGIAKIFNSTRGRRRL